jgi:hypothetical protein
VLHQGPVRADFYKFPSPNAIIKGRHQLEHLAYDAINDAFALKDF